jgi:DNA-binding transcriptional ArsR family regulator
MPGRTPPDPVMTALSHPLRLKILTRASERVSPKQLADELREPIGNVSYHVRTLAEAGLLELVATEPRRGAVEHFYRTSRTARSKVKKAAGTLHEVADAIGR